ncbi:MAG: sugar phosphate isomerase/epimerase [Verrucomicrobia bacterium]|nr:sugar phosphate isomerase/epimerase [Verrucomicrobiota bacterium]MCH8526683.1 sugar phosphate isomerase/epimerase [Kiritimatiellia bacterium]
MSAPYFRTGLVSITFRKHSPEELIDLVVKAGQDGIEWGGDVHVPHGDTARAGEVGERTRDAGLSVAAYGSYYRAAETADNPEFEAVLDSALALGAPTIRVWAGKRASADADEAYRKAVKDDLARICALAAEESIRVALEFHGNTLTDSPDSARDLMESLQSPNLDSLWQPPNGQTLETCMAGLEDMLPHVSNVHVFHWGKGWGDRFALEEGAGRWNAYLSRLASPGMSRWALLEFVKGDDPKQYLRDAETLKAWVDTLSTPMG